MPNINWFCCGNGGYPLSHGAPHSEVSRVEADDDIREWQINDICPSSERNPGINCKVLAKCDGLKKLEFFGDSVG